MFQGAGYTISIILMDLWNDIVSKPHWRIFVFTSVKSEQTLYVHLKYFLLILTIVWSLETNVEKTIDMEDAEEVDDEDIQGEDSVCF